MVGLLLVAGCTTKTGSSDEIRERTANATAEVKKDATALAQGIKEGLTRPNSVNINTATKAQLQSLPGVTAKRADTIIANRPYDSPAELVTKKVLSKAEYDKIVDRIAAKP